MCQLKDPIQEGLQRGWKVSGGAFSPVAASMVCDVAIIGSGAGAGITAELLSKAGLKVVVIEEGPLNSSGDFNQKESEAYPALYLESTARNTADEAIDILRGRCVGGSTTVNWISSFRTPAPRLEFWQSMFGLTDYSVQALAPYFEQAETRLSIAPWLAAPNENIDLLRRGAARSGIALLAISRNVKGCWNIGSCGLGCPTNAKQSMLVTTLPAVLDSGAQLLVETHAENFEFAKGRIIALICRNIEPNSASAQSRQGLNATKIIARNYALAGGAINPLAVLLRSQAPDPHGHLGKRTLLHPVVMFLAVFEHQVAAWSGAPQSIYTDHFLQTDTIDGPIGYKLEAPPLHPVIFASTVPGVGQAQHDLLKNFQNNHTLLVLLRDGFHDESPGGQVELRSDGSPVLDYPLTHFVMEGGRRPLLSMMEIQFAAGARQVLPLHEMEQPYTSWARAREAVKPLPMKPMLTKVVSAHVMGGCSLSAAENPNVTQADGTHWQIENLSVHHASLFPSSIGANPQLSVYGVVNRLAQGQAKKLTGKEVVLA